ncbi:MAG: FAD-dependent monooxygenase [Croceibacterium sp.]
MTAPLVLGAGPAGCAAAIVLAEAGAAPTLLDRDTEVADALCGGFLSWRTAARLGSLGIDPATLGAHRVHTLALFAGRRTAAFALPAPGYGLSRRVLDTELRTRALGAGATLAIDTARGIEGDTVIGRKRDWRGDGLFLAAGKHDVRGHLRPRTARDPAVGLRLRLPPDAARQRLLGGRIELHLFAGGYAGIVVQEGGAANVCLAVRKSRLAGDPAELLARLADENPALGERLGDDWRGVRCETIGAVPYGYLARETAAGLFRVGDQAAVIPSLAGEGIAIALTSGALAARAWLTGGPAAAPAFQRAFAALAQGPVRTAALAWHLAENRALARFGVALAGHVPPVVGWLMRATRLDAAGSLAPVPSAS